MFVIQNPVAVAGVAALAAEVGRVGQTAIDDETNDCYVKLGNTWTKIADGAGNPVASPLIGEVTVRNAAGTVSRKLTAVDGVVTLEPADAIVSNEDDLIVQNSIGSITKNGKASVSLGVVDRVYLRDSFVTLTENGDQVNTVYVKSPDGATNEVDPTIGGGVMVEDGVISALEISL